MAVADDGSDTGGGGGSSFGTDMSDIAQIAGAGLGAYGSYQQGQMNAGIARFNSQIAQQNADQAEAMGAENARRSLVNSTKMVAAGQAAYGASGVSAGAGSAADVLRAGASQGALDAQTIQYNANVRATAFRNQSSIDEYRAQNEAIGGEENAASSILKGIPAAVGLAEAIF